MSKVSLRLLGDAARTFNVCSVHQGFGASDCALPCIAGVFNHDAHPTTAVVVGKVAHHRDAGIIYFDDGRICWPSRARPVTRTGFGSGFPSIATTSSCVPEAQDSNLGSAAIEHVKQDAFTLLHSHRLAMSQLMSVDRERINASVSMGHTLGKRGIDFRSRLAA